MKILVTVKSVVDVQLKLKVKDDQVETAGLNHVINAWDENALEEAMRLKEKNGAEIVTVTIDNSSADTNIRKALAFGADRSVRIDFDHREKDSMVLAKILAAFIAKEKPDLVLCGKQAQDTDRGQVAQMTAAIADLPFAVNVTAVESADGKLNIDRLGETGTEKINLPLPALLAVSDSINEPRLPNIRNIMLAKKKPLDVLNLSDLGISADEEAGFRHLRYLPPPAKEAGKIIGGELPTAVSEAVRILKTEAQAL